MGENLSNKRQNYLEIVYPFNRYPIIPANYIYPTGIIVDSKGNVYKVGELKGTSTDIGSYPLELLVKTPLRKHELYADLTELQMELYVNICSNKIWQKSN